MTAFNLPRFFFVFDVETIGLHGEPFAVGWVVIDASTGREMECGILRSSAAQAAMFVARSGAKASSTDIQWVADHVLPALGGVDELEGWQNIRRPFWKEWKRWEARGALLAADVAWPCEARFLFECVRYTFQPREAFEENRPGGGPYPLIDIASVRLAKGFDPIATVCRLENEEPAHNPLSDARQSARLLLEALRA